MSRLLGPNGLPLGYNERRREAPSYDPGPSAIRERYVDHENGHTIVSTQDCEDTIQGVHAARDVVKKRGRNSKYLGSAPLLVCQIWAKESGTKIGTREFTEYARKRLMGAEYSRFKAWLQ